MGWRQPFGMGLKHEECGTQTVTRAIIGDMQLGHIIMTQDVEHIQCQCPTSWILITIGAGIYILLRERALSKAAPEPLASKTP